MINHYISFCIFVWEFLDYDNFIKSYFEKSRNEMNFIIYTNNNNNNNNIVL